MKKLILFQLFFCCAIFSQAQDTYHSDLQNTLQTEYNLPEGAWMFFDTEEDIINNAGNYGTSFSVQDATGQNFSKKTVHTLNQGAANPWNAGWTIGNKAGIQADDVLLAVFYIRSVGGEGKVNFFIENASTYAKEIILTLPVSEEWRRYLIPFKSSDTYNNNQLNFGFHLGFQAQTIEVGGFTALTYYTNANLESLPNEINNEFYGGYEADAPWRAAAATRIDQLRKADLTVEVKNTSGAPVENAAIGVKMMQHEFGFGSAITANRIAGNNLQNVIYENKLINLDGEGHGFNCVVFENDLKWPAWEQEWFVNKTELVNAVTWLRNQDMKIRGHTLVWPGAENLPNDVVNNINDIDFVKNEINNHLETVLTYPGLEDNIAEWDVLNEIVTNRSLENAFRGNAGYVTGRELYGEIFEEVRSLDPNVGMWINDYMTLTLSNTAGSVPYDQLKEFIQEIVDANVGLEGIGFQAHLGGFPNAIPEVLETYDDFYNSFGLKAKVTEFDLPTFIDQDLAADYLVDFMTATFSHESMDGFLFWNFWDGATWLSEGSNLFNLDWTRTKPGDAYVDLVFGEWWTNETLVTAANGVGVERVFKGLHEVTYTCNGEIITEVVNVIEPTDLVITCDNISTDIKTLEQKDAVKIFPNPAQEFLNIKRKESTPAQVRLMDVTGKVVLEMAMDSDEIQLQVGDLQGVFILEISSEEEQYFEKVIVE